MLKKHLARRSLALIAGSVALALSLGGCAGGNDREPVKDRDLGVPIAGEVKSGAFAGDTLTYASSGGVFQESFDKAVWQPFAQDSGAEVLMDTFDTGKFKAMVDSGNPAWDVVTTTNFDTARACGTLYEEYDYTQIDISHVPEGLITDKCMTPNIVFGLVLVYNTDKFGDNPPTSAADFFDTKNFPGKRAVNMSTFVEPHVAEFAMLADGKDSGHATTEDIDAAFDKYRSLGDNLIGWTSGAQSQEYLESGEASMALVWSGRGYGAADAGAPVAPMWDQWILMVDSTAIPKGAKDKQASHAMVNYMLGAKQQGRLTELTSYGNVNSEAKPEMDDMLASWMVTDHLDTSVSPDFDFWVKNYDTLSTSWANWATGN